MRHERGTSRTLFRNLGENTIFYSVLRFLVEFKTVRREDLRLLGTRKTYTRLRRLLPQLSSLPNKWSARKVLTSPRGLSGAAAGLRLVWHVTPDVSDVRCSAAAVREIFHIYDMGCCRYGSRHTRQGREE